MLLRHRTTLTYFLLGLFCSALLYCGYQWREALQSFLLNTRISFVDIITLIPVAILFILLFKVSENEHKKSDSYIQLWESTFNENLEIQDQHMREIEKVVEFGKLSQGLFHDLMNPLTSILLHTEKSHDRETLEASRNMIEYVRAIRSVMSHESELKNLSLEEEVSRILTLFSYRIRHENIIITIKSSTRRAWFGNASSLQRILLNLISNALDSFEGITERERKIDIVIQQNSISIADNGSGIPPENLDKIFQPFFTTKSRERGTGLGLTLTKNLVESDLGGALTVESTMGKGTTFIITF